MKRILAACLEQTVHFQLKEGDASEEAKRQVKKEFEAYKAKMDRMNTRYKIVSESEQPDGTIVIKIKKQVNSYPVDDYFD